SASATHVSLDEVAKVGRCKGECRRRGDKGAEMAESAEAIIERLRATVMGRLTVAAPSLSSRASRAGEARWGRVAAAVTRNPVADRPLLSVPQGGTWRASI